MREHRRTSGLILAIVVLGTLVVTSQVAGAGGGTTAPAWTLAEPGWAFPYVTPTGDVLALSAVNATSTAPGSMKQLTPDGRAVWSLSSAPTAAQPFIGVRPAVDGNGNSYVEILGASGYEIEKIDAVGQIRWISPPLTIGYAANLALGWNGVLYAGARATGPGGVAEINESTGAETHFASGDVTGLFAYPGGIVVEQDSQQVDYFSYAGVEQRAINTGAAFRSGVGFSSTSGSGGKVFVAGHPTDCSVSVAEVAPTGVQWTWTDPSVSSCDQTFLAATPDGGVILVAGTRVWSISATGQTRWTYTPTAPSGGTIGGLDPPLVDLTGKVVIPFNYSYPSTTGGPAPEAIAADILTATSKTPVLPSINVQESSCADPQSDISIVGYGAVGIGPGRVYVGLQEGWCNPYPSFIQAFSLPGLGSNYRLSVVTPGGLVSPPPPLPRYLALGDSVPYGHGLANPTKGSKSGLAANQGPSTQAWPQYVDAGLPDLRPLKYRSTSCNLGGLTSTIYDQLSYSGAPVTANSYTGKDTNCVYTAGTPVPIHKAVTPEEIVAAALRRDPPALVTLQVGADDIDFGACLESVLGVPTFLGAQQCATRDAKGVLHISKRVSDELSSLSAGLSQVIDTIHGAAPRGQIVLVNYYQVMPRADANLAGSSVICKDLRASAKNSKFRTDARQIADLIQSRLNGAIAAAKARYADVKLVNISSLFAGHEMCTLNSWVFDDAWRAAHPTSVGQTHIGSAVLAMCNALPKKCVGR
jgi:hypothetical protein